MAGGRWRARWHVLDPSDDRSLVAAPPVKRKEGRGQADGRKWGADRRSAQSSGGVKTARGESFEKGLARAKQKGPRLVFSQGV